MSNQTDPIELLRQLAPAVQNGNKETLKQAAELVKQLQAEHADLQSAISRQPLPEAGASATFKVVDPHTQLECLFTVRDAPTARLLIRELGAVAGALAEAGFISVDSYSDQRRAERGHTRELPGAGDSQASKPSGQPVASLPPTAAGGLTFSAKTMEATVNGGKAYWKIKGGKFEKFGVTVWPEVLEDAGFVVEEMNVMSVYNMESYTATYSTKDDGKPDKVTKLVKAA